MATTPQGAPSLLISKSAQITLRDGSVVTHTAQFTGHVEDENASGMLIIEAVCCGDPSTASRHRFPNDITTYSQAAIQAEIEDHVQRVATHHASVQKAKDFISGMLPPSTAAGA